MNFIVMLFAAMLTFPPIALAQGYDTNRTGQSMDENGPRGDTNPSTGSKEPGGSGNAAGQDGLPSRNPPAHDPTDNSKDR
jgi:hypothetical protein